MEPPSPPMAKPSEMKVRETSSSLPRVVRRVLTNKRQRRKPMAESWPRRYGVELMRFLPAASTAGEDALATDGETPGLLLFRTLAQPREFLGGAGASDNAQEDLFQR